MPRLNFDTYSTFVYGNRYDTSSNCAQIVLTPASGAHARRYFSHNTTTANAAPTLQGANVIAHYHMSDFAHIVDLLRNEDSCYLYHNVPSGLVYLGTGREEVDEEES